MTGPSGGTDARSLIKEAFLRLYEECPLKEISAERLAKEAGYSRAAFYRHYHSTADVLSDLEEDMLPVSQSAYIEQHADTLSSALFMEIYLHYFAQYEHPLRILLARDDRGDLYQKLAGTIYPAFYAWLEHRDDIPASEVDRMTSYLVEVKLNQMKSWSLSPQQQPLADYMRLPLETFEREFWQDR